MKKRIAVLFGVILILLIGYHFYSHYMVSKFYDYIDAGDTKGAIAHIEKMPNVNMLDMCYPLCAIEGIMLQYATFEGYPLYYAVWKHADVDVIETLLEKGADPNASPFAVSRSAFSLLCSETTEDWYEKIVLMVEYGADLNEEGLPYLAIYRYSDSVKRKREYFKIVQYIWESGCNERGNVGTMYESTILHVIVENMDVEAVKVLYNSTERPMSYLLNAVDANGETPIFWAVRGEMFYNYMFLISEGADTSIRNNDGKTVYDVAEELGYGDLINNLQ